MKSTITRLLAGNKRKQTKYILNNHITINCSFSTLSFDANCGVVIIILEYTVGGINILTKPCAMFSVQADYGTYIARVIPQI